MIKKLLILTLVLPLSGFAQDATPADTTASKWKFGGLYSFTTTQTSLTNWNAGGTNSVNLAGLLRQSADYDGPKWQWSNTLDANYAINIQGASTLKTGDKLEITSRLDRNINTSGSWTTSLFANFRTQFADGFKEAEDVKPISTWMSPGYLTAGVGFTHKSNGLELYLSPVTMKQTYVLDDSLSAAGSFGVEAGEKLRTELGAYLNATYTRNLREGVDLTSNLNLFSNYLEKPQNIDVSWETILLMEVWGPLSVSLQLHLIYDDDILVQNPNAAGDNQSPGLQVKEVLGVGLAYSFGKYKE